MIFKKEIGFRLQLSFIVCALLILLIGVVCLFSWQKQNQQIHYALEDYIPKIQASVRIDENFSPLFNEFNELAQTLNAQSRLLIKDKIKQRLATLHQFQFQLPPERQASFTNNINNIEQQLLEIDNVLVDYHIVLNQLSEMQTYISWLHNDFNQEISSVLQDISLQQNFMLEQLQTDKQAEQDKINMVLFNIHHELENGANLSLTENRLIEGIMQLIDTSNMRNLQSNLNYLAYLKKNSDELLSENLGSLDASGQIIQELYKISLSPSQLPSLLTQYDNAVKKLNQAIINKDRILNKIKNDIDQQVDSDHEQLIHISNKVQSVLYVSIEIIITTTIIAILFILLFNYFYIRPKIISRLRALNNAVIELSLGNLSVDIPVYGNDELGRIAILLRESIRKIKQQTLQLENEIIDRIEIENNLINTQDDLIQAAKLAVVGQTVTTIAHEINQPLNALSIYLYTIDVANKNQNHEEITLAFEKSQQLILRIKNIITHLREFSKRSDADTPLQLVDLNESINQAWDIISLNKTVHLSLSFSDKLGYVLGNKIRFEQVFVNIFANAIDACEHKQAHIVINKDETADELILYIYDNGVGWPLNDAGQLLTAFTSSKEIGLGIGLSLSQSIMQQSQGSLHIASTLDRHALIVLTFAKSTLIKDHIE